MTNSEDNGTTQEERGLIQFGWSPKKAPACVNCRHCIDKECHRHAPATHLRLWQHPEMGMQYEYITAWPKVRPEDVCGDHEKTTGELLSNQAPSSGKGDVSC